MAGCTATPAPPSDALEYGAVRASFIPIRDDQVIEVRALDRQAISAATLLLPDGRQLDAYALTAVPSPSDSTDQIVGVTAATGSAAGMPLDAAPTQTTTLVGQIESAALIRLVGPADYAQTWRSAKLRITFG